MEKLSIFSVPFSLIIYAPLLRMEGEPKDIIF
jgi:hypothetical protein